MPNFGDARNRILWLQLLPDFFDDDPGELFRGLDTRCEA